MITNRLPEASTATPRSTPDRAAADPTVSPTDGELLMRFTRHGDRDAFAEVVERHRPMVWRVCSRVLVRHADAEDAYQATLLILAKKAGSIRANDSAGGWLFRVAHNAALQSRRRRKALRETSLEESPPAPEPLFPDIQQKQLVAALLEELRSLPAKYQTPLVLRYLEGKSRRQIATSMDVTVATIAGQLVRGRRMLRSRLARRGVSFAAAMGAFGLGSTGSAASAGAIHGGLPAFDPVTFSTAVSSTTSAAVQQLVQQGVRTMFFASATKPAAIGLAALLMTAALLVDPQDGIAQPATPTFSLEAEVGTPNEAPEARGFLVAKKKEKGLGQVASVKTKADSLGEDLLEEPSVQPTELVAHEMILTTLLAERSKPTHVEMKSSDLVSVHTENGKMLVKLIGEGGGKGFGVVQVTVDGGKEKSLELDFGKLVELQKLVGQRSKTRKTGDRATHLRNAIRNPAVANAPAAPAVPAAPTPGDLLVESDKAALSSAGGRGRLAKSRRTFRSPPGSSSLAQTPLDELDVLKIEFEALRMKLEEAQKANQLFQERSQAPKPKAGPFQVGERVTVEVYEGISNSHLLDETIVVDGDGYLALGARWGRFKVSGLALTVVEKDLGNHIEEAINRVEAIRADAGIGKDSRTPVDISVQVTRSAREVKIDPFSNAQRR